ncbi:2-dehydro-3-deoxygalactonokinase [Aminobacter anthyllidis]|uniref:2-dehydro-3-deoxygalactonokinase n=1 Tax=Aminobacter anthyllidis TaxID=1035067 RepID=A0A9X1AC95_9HYPH|nr:2-dehydro-3-deoxygalactonokinase [Aminobacter anthyllidis]MBT1156817.1 2-dehydro-3-deoxygalactonokinase [Aminobacter anthyllidis]
MSTSPVIVAIDWGTTRMRAWLLDTEGAALAENRSDEGLTTAQTVGFEPILERCLAALRAPDGLPVIICGMAGARQGWIEAPYVDVPSSITAILRGAVRVPHAGRDIRIVPGLAQRSTDAPDVMRGEETQLAGSRLEDAGRHVVCMPGTHSKWVVVDSGVVETFRTWPTGELFALLSSHSILRHSIGEQPSPVRAENPVFARACEIALAEGGDFASRLFSIRAGSLLHGLTPEGAAAMLSGLMIGSEVASARRQFLLADRSVTLVASGTLATLYRHVFKIAGLEVRDIDADAAVRIGLCEAARQNEMIQGVRA